MEKWVQYAIMLVLLAFFTKGYGQDSTRVCKNSIKVDLIGIPMTLLWIPKLAYPRMSVEFEHSIRGAQRLSWLTDVEWFRFEEAFNGEVAGQFFFDAGNRQKNLSLIGGLRYYPFRTKEKENAVQLFIEPRVAFTLAHSKLNPHTIDDPLEFRTGFFVAPRLRGGVVLMASRHVGFDLSIDPLLHKSLATRKYLFLAVAELNFLLSF